jgi:hypothetical protein
MDARPTNMTTRETIIAHVESIIAGNPSLAALQWLADGFSAHVHSHGTLTDCLGLDDHCPQGLPLAMARSRWRAKIAEALSHLPKESSSYSMARVISDELARYRSRRPKDQFSAALHDAKQIHPTGTASVSGLREVIVGIREAT